MSISHHAAHAEPVIMGDPEPLSFRGSSSVSAAFLAMEASCCGMPYEDYIAGEIDQPDRASIRRVADGRIDGARVHILSFLGQTWGKGSPRVSEEQIIRWTRDWVAQGAVVTWDVPIQPNGLISKPFIEQLAAAGKALAQR
jgi:hypothetical protein